MPTKNLKLVGTIRSRADAVGLLKSPGDAVVIERGRPRWLLLACPCGCGEELPINLDARAGPAWRIYRQKKTGEVSVYPSVWRDVGCGSHFIIWSDQVFLFGGDDDELGDFPTAASVLSPLVFDHLSTESHSSYADVAEALGEIPWDVLSACRALVRKGLAEEGQGKERGAFRRRQ